MDELRTIIVPVDFTRASIAAFENALRIRGANTTIVVVHVVDQAHVDFTVELGYGMHADIEAKARQHAEQHMRRLTESAQGDVERVVVLGNPTEKILDLARELEADVIVIGRPPVERQVPGAFAEQILRFARCPVLSIPGEAGLAEVESDTRENAPAGAPSAT